MNEKFISFPKTNKFESPYKFDIHYSDYFEYYKYYELNTEFEYFNGDNRQREALNDLLMSLYLNQIYILFGKGGIEKSISIIKTFKYNYNHRKKELYILIVNFCIKHL